MSVRVVKKGTNEGQASKQNAAGRESFRLEGHLEQVDPEGREEQKTWLAFNLSYHAGDF
jgi:hypothetical protein